MPHTYEVWISLHSTGTAPIPASLCVEKYPNEDSGCTVCGGTHIVHDVLVS